MRMRLTTACVLVLALAGCDNFLSLKEDPKTFLAKEQFFTSAADAEAAVLAAYETFQDLEYYRARFLSNLMGMADYVNGRGSYLPGSTYNCDQTCKGRIWSGWNNMYQGINRANLVIDQVPGVTMNEARKAEFVAEAKFIRGLNYYNLVRYWGAVPLRVQSVDSFEKLPAPRAPVAEVYDQIVADLKAAEQSLPETNTNGRATRWAATLLLADVHLAREQWAEAAAKAKQVMDSPRFALVEVKVASDFEKIFGADVVTSSEEVFDIPFIRQNGFGWELPAMLNPPSPYAAGAYRALFGNMNSFLATWDTTDLRYQHGLYIGADRKYLSKAEPQYFKKFHDRAAVGRQGHGNDYPVVRYADALLIFAEAESQAKGGPTPAAYKAVNRIRRRAYGLNLSAPSPRDLPVGLSAQAFRDAVIQERAYEFISEGKRYWDLKRTGKIEQAITASGEPYDPKYMLWPLPDEELDANEALSLEDQNPGW